MLIRWLPQLKYLEVETKFTKEAYLVMYSLSTHIKMFWILYIGSKHPSLTVKVLYILFLREYTAHSFGVSYHFSYVIFPWLRSYVTNDILYFPGKAVIYGASFASYTFIQGILASGIPGSRLVMIQPPSNLPSCFNNPEVDELVEQSLENAGTIFCTFVSSHFVPQIFPR